MTEIQKFIENLGDKSPSNIRSQIYKRGILSSYNDDDGRMVFYSSKNQRFNKSDDLKLECNGLVFDTKNLKTLVIPQLLHKSGIDTDVINNHLNNDLYDILCVDDGTVINLYYWIDSWRISTARSYDLTDKKWSIMTYKEVVKDILGEREDAFYNTLDKEKCYTFGLKHKDLHPFLEGKDEPVNKFWFIQSVDLKDHSISYNFKNDLEILGSTYSNIESKNIKELFPLLKKSLNDFIYRKNETKINYGYILRSKDPKKTGENSIILLESSLLQNIRKLFYHSSFNKVSQEMDYDRETYIIINSFLDVNRNYLFKLLFPQYLQTFAVLDNITNDLVNNIIYNKNSIKLKNKKFTLCNPSKIYTQKLQKYTETLYELIGTCYTINPRDKNLSRVISTYLLNENWTDMYYKLFTIIS